MLLKCHWLLQGSQRGCNRATCKDGPYATKSKPSTQPALQTKGGDSKTGKSNYLSGKEKRNR